MQTKEIKWPLMANNITKRDLESVIKLLQEDDPKLTNGPKVVEFEEAWSKWLGTKHSVMLNSGASANDLTMLALREIKGVGEVIVPGLTWVSDIASVLNAGHTPIFVDINKNTLGMATDLILNAITKNTKAVFLTHVLGFNALTDSLIDELRNRKVLLIEDVCESHGATHKGEKVGTFGWASNFSFYYAHHMTTIEGGMISTNDEEMYQVVRMMRSHGMVRESTSPEIKAKYIKSYPDLNPDFIFAYGTHNMRSTEINALIGLSQLENLDENNEKRKINFDKFLNSIDESIFQSEFDSEGNSNYAFTLILKDPNFKLRDEVEVNLNLLGIEFRRGLAGGGNQLRQPYLRKLRDIPMPESLPNVDFVHHFGWYLGNYPNLDDSFFSEIAKIKK
jgi:CDP-4-dehydro-6-deoxyglucose reductase, E1